MSRSTTRCPISLAGLIAFCALLLSASSAQAGELATFSQDPVNGGCVADVSGINHPSCTANDVRLTEIVSGSLVLYGNCSTSGTLCQENADCGAGQTCDGKGCTTAAGDTVTFSATGRFVAGPQRYDVGLYISTDADSDGNGARFGSCTRFAFDNGEGTPALPDLDNDQCGDVNASSTTAVDFGPVTILCIDNKSQGATLNDPPVNTPDGQADINHCETWAQRVNEINCQDSEDVRAGTGSKCFCGLLAGACIAISDGSDCTRDVCQGTCQTSTGSGSHTVCEDNGDCPGAGETCQAITLQHIGDTTVECRPAAGDCDLPEHCAADGSCPADVLKSASVECRPSACGTALACCDVAENCTGSSADCPGDGFKPSGTVCRLSDGSTCDPPETCSGTSATCGPDVCVGNISHP